MTAERTPTCMRIATTIGQDLARVCAAVDRLFSMCAGLLGWAAGVLVSSAIIAPIAVVAFLLLTLVGIPVELLVRRLR